MSLSLSFSLWGSTKIRSCRSCAQVTGGREGNGKVDEGGGKTSPSHPFPLCPYLHPVGLWSQNPKIGDCRKCGTLFRPKNTPVCSRQSHDLWTPLIWPLPSSPPYYLVSPILLYFQKQRRRVQEKLTAFSPEKYVRMFSFAKNAMPIFFSTVTFVWLKNPLAFDYDTRKSLIASVDKEL